MPSPRYLHNLIKLGQKISLAGLCTLSPLIWTIDQAVGWTVEPHQVELSHLMRTEAIVITNDADFPIFISAKAASWPMAGGTGILLSTQKLSAYLALLIALDSKEAEMICVGISRNLKLAQDTNYRISFEELPAIATNSTLTIKSNLIVDLPVLIRPYKDNPDSYMSWVLMGPDIILSKADLNYDNPKQQHEYAYVANFPALHKRLLISAAPHILSGQGARCNE